MRYAEARVVGPSGEVPDSDWKVWEIRIPLMVQRPVDASEEEKATCDGRCQDLIYDAMLAFQELKGGYPFGMVDQFHWMLGIDQVDWSQRSGIVTYEEARLYMETPPGDETPIVLGDDDSTALRATISKADRQQPATLHTAAPAISGVQPEPPKATTRPAEAALLADDVTPREGAGLAERIARLLFGEMGVRWLRDP